MKRIPCLCIASLAAAAMLAFAAAQETPVRLLSATDLLRNFRVLRLYSA
jgi:hypothetical protein